MPYGYGYGFRRVFYSVGGVSTNYIQWADGTPIQWADGSPMEWA